MSEAGIACEPNGAGELGRLVVLGHTGFIGVRLCRALSVQFPGVELVGLSPGRIDLTTTDAAARLRDHLNGSTTVLMLAGIKKQMGDTLEICERNLAMASSVCRAIQEHPVRRVIFYSSADVYGESTHQMDVTETTPVHPTSYYGVAKFASEGLFRKATATSGASLAILRPPLVYGPGDPSASYGPNGFARAAVWGEPITLWGGGEERRDFLYVDDLVAATCRLVTSSANAVINVASGCSSTFRDVLEAIGRIQGAPLQVTCRPRTRPRVDQGYRIDRLRAILADFRPTSLDHGLRPLLAAEREAQASGAV